MLPKLPAEGDGYTEAYIAMHELMLPLDKQFSGETFLVESTSTSTSWQQVRHAIRRVSLVKKSEHPFGKAHAKKPLNNLDFAFCRWYAHVSAFSLLSLGFSTVLWQAAQLA